MPDTDVVVVGAGVAGLCCAATLLSSGLSVTLVCETPEVGWALRSVAMGKSSKGFVQHPMYQPGLGGGSWYTAARWLKVPASFHVSPATHLLNKDTGRCAELRFCVSAPAIVDVFAELAPMPITEQRPAMERIIHEALMMSWEELGALQTTQLGPWVAERDPDPLVPMIMNVLAANVTETTPEIAAEHISVYGMMASLRAVMCGEALITAPAPDPWEGLLVPMGKALEAAGCPVRRSSKVDRVIIENGRAVGVVLQGGDEVRGRAVALAVGGPRVPALLDEVPEEVCTPLDYAAKLPGHDACTYSLLDSPVVPIQNMTMVSDAMGNNLAYLFPMHAIAPDSTEEGRYLLAAQATFSDEQYAEIGGHDGAVKKLLALQEELFPGFESATVERKEQTHRHGWLSPFTKGPKLPERSQTYPGLYFAGDGSAPFLGIGMEAAGKAGTMRARRIVADLTT